MKLDLKTTFDHKYGRWLNERTRRGPAEVSFLPPCFLLPWDTIPLIAGKALAFCSGGSRGGAGTPLLLFFNPNWGPKDRKKFFWDRAPPVSQGLDDPPPPYLKVSQSKFLSPSQFPYLGQSILSSQLLQVHFVCATLITPVCLFFYQTGTDLSSSQSRFVSYFRSVFNLVA